MSFFALPVVGEIIKKVLDFIPNPQAKAEAQLKFAEMQQNGELAVLAAEVAANKGQTDINLEEAKHESLFVSGWRPFIGWTCGLGLLYQFLIWPIFSSYFPELRTLDMGDLLTILLGLLGLGGLRTYEKLKGVART